jgi:phosphoribosyl-ATP pyrophosphohydrolase
VSNKHDFSRDEVASVAPSPVGTEIYRVHCNKLVRGNIPLMIKAGGGRANISVRRGGQLIIALKKKLVEECHEMRRAKSRDGFLRELADFLEALLTLMNQYDLPLRDLFNSREEPGSSRINLLKITLALLRSNQYRESRGHLIDLYYHFLLLLERKNINFYRVVDAMHKKKKKNGDFSGGLFIQYFDIPGDHPKLQLYSSNKQYRVELLPAAPEA